MFNTFKRRVTPVRYAGIYRHPTGLIVHALFQPPAGFLVSCEPIFRLPETSPAEEIGRSVRVALDAFRENVPDPPDWKAHRAQFLRATGFKSWKAFEGPAKSCWLEESDGFFVLTPLRNGGSRGDSKGFQPFGKEPVRAPAAIADQELGKTLLEVLARCE